MSLIPSDEATKKDALTILPAELLLQIASHLPSPDFAAISRTCRLLHHLQQNLYHTVTLSFNFEDAPYSDETHRIHAFFRTLTSRPDLALCVRQISFVNPGGYLCGDNDDFIEYPPPTDLKELWDQMAQDILPKWFKEGGAPGRSKTCEVNFQCAIILTLLENLVEINIDYTVFQADWCIEEILRKPDYSRNLLRLRVKNDVDCRIFRWEGCNVESLAVHEMLQLEELSILDTPLIRINVPNLQESLSLQVLDISNFDTDPVFLGQILSRTPQLKKLRIFVAQNLETLKNDEGFEYGYEDEWEDYGRQLELVKDTLSELVVSIDYGYIDDYPPDSMDEDWVSGVWERRGSIGSLKNLHRLQRLEMPTCVLLGWHTWPITGKPQTLYDVLPPSLKELCLRDDMMDHPDYQWTPWDSGVVGRNLASSFQDTCNPISLIWELREYINSIEHKAKDEGVTPSLLSICLKVQKDRAWKESWLYDLRNLCRKASFPLSCTMRERMSGFLTSWKEWNEDVREIIICDSSTRSGDVSSDDDDEEEDNDNGNRELEVGGNESEGSVVEEESAWRTAIPSQRRRSTSASSSLCSISIPHTYQGFPCRYLEEPRRQFRDNC
jgi:hypothetical protein